MSSINNQAMRETGQFLSSMLKAGAKLVRSNPAVAKATAAGVTAALVFGGTAKAVKNYFANKKVEAAKQEAKQAARAKFGQAARDVRAMNKAVKAFKMGIQQIVPVGEVRTLVETSSKTGTRPYDMFIADVTKQEKRRAMVEGRQSMESLQTTLDRLNRKIGIASSKTADNVGPIAMEIKDITKALYAELNSVNKKLGIFNLEIIKVGDTLHLQEKGAEALPNQARMALNKLV